MLSFKNIIKISINTLVGVFLIVVWLKFVDVTQIFATISKVDPISLIPIFIFLFLSPVIRALRLKIFLSEIKKISFNDLIFLNGVSQLLNFFIPIRAGEIAKGVYLNTHYNLELGKSVVWIFLDRFVDFLVVLLVSGILVLIIPTSLPANFAPIIAFILVSSIAVTYLAIFKSHIAKKIAQFLSYLLIVRFIKIQFNKFSTSILDSFSILNRHPKDLFLMVSLSILAYGADGFIWYFSFRALGVTEEYIRMFLGQMLSALTYLIPAAPGYVGSAEASGLLILSGVLGVNAGLSSAVVVLTHILTAVFILIYGLISVYLLKIDLGVMIKKALKRG